jgi:micrococcal nuclease
LCINHGLKKSTQYLAFLCCAFGAFICCADETASVLQVIDGDTCSLEDKRKIRYLGIDAPETGEMHAEEATQANNKLVGGQKIRLELGKPPKDRDGRVLAYVFVDKTFVNEELVRAGHAYLRHPIAAKYKEKLVKAQDEAREAGRGIWAKAADRHIAIVSVHTKQGSKTDINDEYIVIENRGEKDLDLTGWTVSDEAHHRYLFPRFTLAAGSQVTLRTGSGKNTSNELHWGNRSSIWNDKGDTVFIRDADANLVLSHVL